MAQTRRLGMQNGRGPATKSAEVFALPLLAVLALGLFARLRVWIRIVLPNWDISPGQTIFFARAFEWSPSLAQVYALYGPRLQLEGRNAEAAIAYRHSNQLSANQIATVGLNQTLEATKIAQPVVTPAR